MPGRHLVAASADRGGFFTTLVGAEDRADAEEMRMAVQAQLVQHGVPLDELEMASCEAIWPGPKTSAIRASIEAERQRA